MIAKTVDITLDTFDPEFVAKATPEQLSEAMGEEVKLFNQALLKAGLQMLTSYERTILKTYIAWKLGVPLRK